MAQAGGRLEQLTSNGKFTLEQVCLAVLEGVQISQVSGVPNAQIPGNRAGEVLQPQQEEEEPH